MHRCGHHDGGGVASVGGGDGHHWSERPSGLAGVAVVEVDGQNFAMLAPHEEMLESEDQLEVALFAYEEDEEGATYSDIEDEALFERVREYCIALLRDEA